MNEKSSRLAVWVTSKVPFYVFFGIIYLSIIWVLHLNLPFYHKTNDLWRDEIFSEPIEEEAFPDNIILIDIEQWPYYKDNRKEAQTARDEVVTGMIEIIDLLNRDPKKKPPFIGIDMTFESFAKEDIMKQLLEKTKQQDNIFLSVEIDREKNSLKFHDNFFWNKIKENIEKIRERLTIVSLEKYKDEPVRRYKTFYKARLDDKGPVFKFPSMGTVIAKMLNRYYLGDNNEFEVPDRTSRFRFRYLIKNVKKDFQKYHVYSLQKANQGGRFLKKLLPLDPVKHPQKTFYSPSGNFSRCIVIFGRIDPDPNGRDRLPVCALVKEEGKNDKKVQATLPGAMVHLNAAMSILMKENIKPLEKWKVFVGLLGFLILFISIHFVIARIFSRWSAGLSQWYPNIFLFIAVVLILLILDYLLKLPGNRSVEIPIFTFYMFPVKFLPLLMIIERLYRYMFLRFFFSRRYRKFMKTFRKSLVQCVVEGNPMLRFKSVVDLFKTIMIYLAFYDLARWRSIPNRKKLKLVNIRRTSIEKLRGLIKDLDLKVNSLFVENNLDKPGEGFYHLLLKARNDFRHQGSSALNKREWDRRFDESFPILLSFMECLKEELCNQIEPKPLVSPIKSFWKSRNLFSKRFLAAGGNHAARGPYKKKELYLYSNGEKLSLFPLFQELECDYHGKRETFVYASGLGLKGAKIEVIGYTPFCKPLLKNGEEGALNKSFKELEEELKNAKE